jgi:hypothetical protein
LKKRIGEEMSSTLTWKPEKSNGNLPYELKVILERRLSFAHGGSKVDDHDLKYFEALADAQVPGAKEVIELIKTHGAIILKLEY